MHQSNKLIDIQKIRESFKGFKETKPFPYAIIDGFFNDEVARQLESEVPRYDSGIWHNYKNPIEVKKVCNNWNVFPKLTYSIFSALNSSWFLSELSKLTGEKELFPDEGLNGGGWHIHSRGGKLNTHLDYSIHPKLGLERKFNIIIYLNSEWNEEWGGHLGFWDHNQDTNSPKNLLKKIAPKFNRAVIFDTTCNSWHGLPEPIDSPECQYRKSLAIYYLKTPADNADQRGKALFAPTDDQKTDKDVLNLIKLRADTKTASSVYE